MELVVHDTFTDVDRTKIEDHVPDVYPGPTQWVRYTTAGNTEIVNNRIQPVKTQPLGWVINSGISDCIITASMYCSGVGSGEDGPDMGIVFRMRTDAFDEGLFNHFLLRPNADDFLFQFIWEGLGGGYSLTNDALGSNAGIVRSIKIILKGSSVQCYVDNTLLFNETDDTHTTNVYHGFNQFGSYSVYGVWLDDFKVDADVCSWTEITPIKNEDYTEIDP
jgi:hypothetical protein